MPQYKKAFNLKNLFVAALALEFAFAYFIYQSLKNNTKSILTKYGDDESSSEAISIAIAVFFTLFDVICNVTYINPAQAAYETNNNNVLETTTNDAENAEQNKSSNIVGETLTAIIGHVSFVAGSCGNTPVLANISLSYIRWPLNIVFMFLGTAYYHMLSYRDLITHSRYIYPKIFSLKESILVHALKNPLKSFEMLLQIAGNGFYRATAFSYMTREFVRDNFELGDNEIMFSIMGTAAVATLYGTVFTRTLPIKTKLFPQTSLLSVSANIKEVLGHNKGLFSKEMGLSLMRASGIMYLSCRYIQNLRILLPFSIFSGAFLLLQASSTSYKVTKYAYFKEQFPPLIPEHTIVESHPASQYAHGKTIGTATTTVNVLARITRTLAFLGFMNTLNDVSGLELPINDLLAITFSLGVPIAINDFLYFNTKLKETWGDCVWKYQQEKRQPRFGRFCSFFHAKEEYRALPQASSTPFTTQPGFPLVAQ